MVDLKGQFGMMEHLLMAVILLMVIVAAMFFFFGFQSTKSKGAAFKDDISKILLTTNLLSKSPFLVKEDGIFDDSKLVGFTGAYARQGCEEVSNITGPACITVERVLAAGDKNECDPVNFQERGKNACNVWTICNEVCLQLQNKQSRGLSIPVNIFRKLENRVDLGVLTVKVPS